MKQFRLISLDNGKDFLILHPFHTNLYSGLLTQIHNIFQNRLIHLIILNGTDKSMIDLDPLWFQLAKQCNGRAVSYTHLDVYKRQLPL